MPNERISLTSSHDIAFNIMQAFKINKLIDALHGL